MCDKVRLTRHRRKHKNVWFWGVMPGKRKIGTTAERAQVQTSRGCYGRASPPPMSTARTKRRVACERNREDSSLEIWTIFAREHKNITKGNYSIPSIIMEFPSHIQYINRYTSTNHRLIPHHSTLYPSILSMLSTVLRRPNTFYAPSNTR